MDSLASTFKLDFHLNSNIYTRILHDHNDYDISLCVGRRTNLKYPPKFLGLGL